ncbi:MAG TPA: HD domain-containing protein [Candidatus Hydrothermia bacterium]|nr:HD domain-containing protein [Candidatus Hydrothermae bacterium]MDD3649733.1 HD domain-containing protein [Candidatus Hydrothermia bacterium]MDD5572656.1 HD domain-containing protein [Candidatus Hydrothermia bacterium]HOK23645.1 HD domain-containing protein [Candidatus Hydrothermia bacterium]HOL24374.1 HD domain-containing protein [Candidatus Hydrothermia bacterium]
MEKKFFIVDLQNQIGKELEDLFQIKDMQIRSSKDGQSYLEILLADITGSQTARAFENVDEIKVKIERGRVHRIKLQVYQFSDQLGIKVLDVYKVGEYNLRDFVPSSSVDSERLEGELRSIIKKVENPDLKLLLKRIFIDDNELRKKFLLAPAAKMNHHDYSGGLAEHTLQIARVSEMISKMYVIIDRDLLVAGALLHDIGKVFELEYTPDIEYTDEGKLLGHLIIGYELVSKKIHELEFMGKFPEELRMKILHMVLSHHGEQQYGSPVKPMFLEAQILHFLDNLDAKAYMFKKAYDLRSQNNARWSEYSKPLGRSIYLGEPEDTE